MITRHPRTTSSILATLLRPSTSTSIPQSYICTPCRRQLHRGLPENGRVPPPTPFVPDVPTFLKLVGRELSKHESKIASWDELFTLTSEQLKERGIDPPRTRRYLLRWREKFRKGDYGIGGDLEYVQDGVAELRVVEVPRKKDAWTVESAPEETTEDLKKPTGFKLKNGYIIKGKQVHPMKGTHGSGAVLKAVEGLWEHKRGHKVYGGERRRAQTLHKMRVEESKKNR
ncbi:telomere length regulation protein [Exophiala xenobiotica]|nr:telomere length regulation protein [Exophiala xenobiotica]KAK5558968.1 telomere length regulation protein [Exophiala xenobiotica]